MTKQELGDMIISFTDDWYRIAKAILKEDADCEDAVSSAIVKGFSKIHTLKKQEYAKTWFSRIRTLIDPKTGYSYIQTISFDISGKSIVKDSATTTTTDGIPVTIGKVKVSASGTYLDLTWNFGQDKDSYQKFDQIMNDDNIHNWIFCRITDSNGNTYDTQTSNAAFHSALSDDTGGESAFIGDDGNCYFKTQVVIPDMTQDFSSLQITPYIHLEDGTETDLDFASFRVDYK